MKNNAWSRQYLLSKCSKPMHCNATKSGKLSQILILKFFKYFNTSNSSNTLRLQTLIFNGKRVSDEKDGFSSTESTSNIIKKKSLILPSSLFIL